MFFLAAGGHSNKEDPFDPLPLSDYYQGQVGDKNRPSIEKPKRPLSAYNLFFRSERGKLLAQLPRRNGQQPKKSHGKLGFKDMATIIGKRWRELDEVSKAPYLQLAKQEKIRYVEAKANYRTRMRQELVHGAEGSATSSTDTATCNSYEFSDLSRQLGPEMVDLLIATFK